MAAEEEPSRPSFLVVSDILYDIRLVNNPQDWAKVKCLRREAYGCGEKGDLIVDGLTLYVRAGPEDAPHLHPSLCIGATRDVLSSVGSEIDDDMAECFGRDISLSGSIYTVAGDVVVLRVSFLAGHKSSDFRTYYLVYDSTAAALFLLPHELPHCNQLCTTFPLKVKVEDNNYSLVIMAESTPKHPYPVFLTWSPPPPTCEQHKLSNRNLGWRVSSHICDDARSFQASVMFLHEGSAVWGDLGLGVMYCDWSQLNNNPHLLGPLLGKFKHLPTSCRTKRDIDDPPLAVYRNMGRVGNSIWFVMIKPSKRSPGETMVGVWTLDLLSTEGEWEELSEFKMRSIWELDGFRDKRLPLTVPKFPILRQQDHGILYMLLPDPSRGGGSYAHLVGIHLSSSHGHGHKRRLVMNRRLSIPWMCRPIVVDPDLFKTTHNMTV
uniref:Uncharacterized protein n=1 Tax=Avena sativa TaxID=4498 RepID=A0ACD6ABU1_AVESA